MKNFKTTMAKVLASVLLAIPYLTAELLAVTTQPGSKACASAFSVAGRISQIINSL